MKTLILSVLFAVSAVFNLHAADDASLLVYSGAFLPEDDGVGALMFEGKNIDDYDVLSTVWNETLTLGFGYKAAPFFARRSAGELVVQLQHYNGNDSRCCKIVLRQNGDDIYGAIVYARAVTGSCMVGEDWDTFNADKYKIHVQPAPGATDTSYGLGVDQLTLATRAEAGTVVTEVKGDEVVAIGSGEAYTADRVKTFDVPGFQIGDSGLLNVLLRPNDKWDGATRLFDRPLTGGGGRVRFAPGAYGTRPDCADEAIAVTSSTNAGFLGWSNAAKLLVAKNVPMPQIVGFECGLYYCPALGQAAVRINETKITNFANNGTTCSFQVRGYDPVDEVFRFVRVWLVVVGNDIWGYMDKLGSWTGTIDDDLDMEKYGNLGLCMRDGGTGLGVCGGKVLEKTDGHLGWSNADRHLVAPGVVPADVTDFTGTVYKRTSGVTKRMVNCRSFGFSKDSVRGHVQIRGVDPDDETHVYFCYVQFENVGSSGNLYGWILKIGDYYGALDDEIDVNQYGNIGISNWAGQNGQGVCDFHPVCAMSATTQLELRGSTTAGSNGVVDVVGGDASALKVTVKDVMTLPTNGVVNVRTNAELIVDGGSSTGDNKVPIIPAKTINVFRGGALRVRGDYELSASTYVYLYGGEWQIGYGRSVDGDAFQHAYYLYMANGARVWGAAPRISNWQRTFWRSAGRTPSTVDCDVRLVPGSATNTGFYLDVYEVTGDDAEDLHFNGKIIHAGSKAPAEGGNPCPVVKRIAGTLAFNKAGGDFLDWYPLQIEAGAVRFGVSDVVKTCAGGAPIEMSDKTKLVAAANTANSANTLKVLDDAAATLVLEAGASLTFSGLEFGSGVTSLTVIGDLEASSLRFATQLTDAQLARIRVKATADSRAVRVSQDADGVLCKGGFVLIFR